MDQRIAEIEEEYRRDDLPAFEAGDSVRVRVRVKEGDKERLQPFEGICISKGGSGVSETFTVRKVSGGVGVERVFPLHSPSIDSIEVIRRGSVRRAKLYYLRDLQGKKARVREKAWWLDKIREEEGEAAAAAAEAEAAGEAPPEDADAEGTADVDEPAAEADAGEGPGDEADEGPAAEADEGPEGEETAPADAGEEREQG